MGQALVKGGSPPAAAPTLVSVIGGVQKTPAALTLLPVNPPFKLITPAVNKAFALGTAATYDEFGGLAFDTVWTARTAYVQARCRQALDTLKPFEVQKAIGVIVAGQRRVWGNGLTKACTHGGIAWKKIGYTVDATRPWLEELVAKGDAKAIANRDLEIMAICRGQRGGLLVTPPTAQ